MKTENDRRRTNASRTKSGQTASPRAAQAVRGARQKVNGSGARNQSRGNEARGCTEGNRETVQQLLPVLKIGLRKLIEDAFAIGFMCSREGYNADSSYEEHAPSNIEKTTGAKYEFVVASPAFCELRALAVARFLK